MPPDAPAVPERAGSEPSTSVDGKEVAPQLAPVRAADESRLEEALRVLDILRNGQAKTISGLDAHVDPCAEATHAARVDEALAILDSLGPATQSLPNDRMETDHGRAVPPSRAHACASHVSQGSHASVAEAGDELTAEGAVAQAALEGLELVRAAHSTGYKCVYREKPSGRVLAKLTRRGKRVLLGHFGTVEAAALAAARYARKHGIEWKNTEKELAADEEEEE